VRALFSAPRTLFHGHHTAAVTEAATAPDEVALATTTTTAAATTAAASTVRRATLRIPAAPLGPENPLPALHERAEPHRLDPRERVGLPADMARQIGYAPLRSVLPVRVLDGYGRDRRPTDLDAIVVENDRLRATVLPGLGGRLYSLLHKPSGRELLYRNPVLQPADFALAGAWFSGGVEWNLGATGHAAHTCAPLHAARLPAPDGGQMLRLWEWERLRDLPFQVDLWLPAGSDFLYVGVRVRNPHDRTVPAYWWSNTAVPESADTRVLTPADAAWHFDYHRTLTRIPVPHGQARPGSPPAPDLTYTTRSEHAADYFFDIPDGDRRWIAALDGQGGGLVQTSTDRLRGRKLFRWGRGRGGRRWQEWLTEPGTGGYLEIQAGLARTQLEHLAVPAESELSWLEVYGPLDADPALVHGADWAAARAEAATRLEAALPRAAVDAAYTTWLARADADPAPEDVLATGSGWGALEVERGRFELPGTPFAAATLGPAQQPWRELLLAGVFPRPAPGRAPGPTLVAPEWRDLLESADTYAGSEWYRDYHLGVAQWAAGDRAQAVRNWERSLAAHPSPWALRALAVADAATGRAERSAERYAAAYDLLAVAVPAADGAATPDGSLAAARRALTVEAVPVLLAAGRPEDAERMLDHLVAGAGPAAADPAAGAPLDGGRLRLLRARTALAQGDPARARALLDEGLVVDDLREGEEVLSETWYAVAEALITGGATDPADDIRTRADREHPLPAGYDFRMRPREQPPITR
jgi:tetratricopeptide (TPR) repeat protein